MLAPARVKGPPQPPVFPLPVVPAETEPLHTESYPLSPCLLSGLLMNEQLRVQKEEWEKHCKVEKWTTVPIQILLRDSHCKLGVRQLTAKQETSPLKYFPVNLLIKEPWQAKPHKSNLALTHSRGCPNVTGCKQHASFCMSSMHSFESGKIKIPEWNNSSTTQ